MTDLKTYFLPRSIPGNSCSLTRPNYRTFFLVSSFNTFIGLSKNRALSGPSRLLGHQKPGQRPQVPSAVHNMFLPATTYLWMKSGALATSRLLEKLQRLTVVILMSLQEYFLNYSFPFFFPCRIRSINFSIVSQFC